MGFLSLLPAGPEAFRDILYKLSKSSNPGGINLLGELPSEDSVGLLCVLPTFLHAVSVVFVCGVVSVSTMDDSIRSRYLGGAQAPVA